ncbi:hypothetical protein ACQJBY_017878 [Aegilops geniculata]
MEDGRAMRRMSIPTRRSRSADFHNFSERRRRDKINEKLKALQELLPNCTKVHTDKVSMLDEAIDYLKSLQLQLQEQRGVVGSSSGHNGGWIPERNSSYNFME